MALSPVLSPLTLCQHVGSSTLGLCKSIGQLTLFMFHGLRHIILPPFYPANTLRALMNIGYGSLPVVGLTALFTGMVLALQSYTGFSRQNAEGAIPSIVVLSITRELVPVLAGLMIAGRVGASIAAEIGTMRVSEQIDALKTLSVNPIKYLVAPRLFAGIVTLPILVFIGDVIGIFGGYFVAVQALGFNGTTFLQGCLDALEPMDVISGLIKSSAFGFIVCLMGCYMGYHSDRGAQGVGKATTNAVVSSSILILIFNYVLTQIFFS